MQRNEHKLYPDGIIMYSFLEDDYMYLKLLREQKECINLFHTRYPKAIIFKVHSIENAVVKTKLR